MKKLLHIAIKQTLLGLCLCVIFSPVSAQYEDHEDFKVDDYRNEIPFTYPQGKVTIKYNPDTQADTGHGQGDISYDQEPELDRLLTMSRNMNTGEFMEGYRVQIYAGGNLKVANNTRADFIETYSDVVSYRIWVQPTFRIRVGDFPTRSSANQFCQEIRKHFIGAFVVPDKVKKPKLRRGNHDQHDLEIQEVELPDNNGSSETNSGDGSPR